MGETSKKTADSESARSELPPYQEQCAKSSKYSRSLNSIAAILSVFLKIVLFVLVFLAIIFVFREIYTPQGIVIQPFDVSNIELSGITVSDQLTAELLRIKKIHSFRYKEEAFYGGQSTFTATIYGDISDEGSIIVPAREIIMFSLADTGTIDIGFGPFDPGKLIIAFKNICPGSAPDTVIRGSLQRSGANTVLVSVMEGDEIRAWAVRQREASCSYEQIYDMIRNMAYMIVHDISQPDVSAKTWEGLMYYTEALDAYNRYKLTGDIEGLSRAGNYSLNAIASEKGYKYPYDLLGALEVAYISFNDQDNATYFCNKALELDPESEFGWNIKGIVLYNFGYLNESIQAYNNSIKINPKYLYAWNNKGRALLTKGHWDSAIEAYDEALKIDPKYAGAWYSKGLAHLYKNDNIEAIKAFDRALKINPKNEGAWYHKGQALMSQGNCKDACCAFDKALMINSDYADARRDKEKAIECIKGG